MKQRASSSPASPAKVESPRPAFGSQAPGILPRLAAGGPDVLEECIELYGKWIWAVTREFTQNTADAEAATLEIFDCIRKQAPAFDLSNLSETEFISKLAASCMTKYARKRGHKADGYL